MTLLIWFLVDHLRQLILRLVMTLEIPPPMFPIPRTIIYPYSPKLLHREHHRRPRPRNGRSVFLLHSRCPNFLHTCIFRPPSLCNCADASHHHSYSGTNIKPRSSRLFKHPPISSGGAIPSTSVTPTQRLQLQPHHHPRRLIRPQYPTIFYHPLPIPIQGPPPPLTQKFIFACFRN